MSETTLRLTELVPLETLEQLRELFEATVGVPMVFTDAEGMALTQVGDPLRFCGTLVKVPSGGTVCLRRARWDVPEAELEQKILAGHSNGGGPVAHRCMGGFRDTAVPLVVEGKVLGFAVFARSLVQAPDVEGFRAMAVDAGMAAETGEAVARAALVMGPERVKQVAQFLQAITGLVVKAAYEQLRARQVLALEDQRDALVHMIVHDLRTPLTGILTGLQTVVELEYEDDIVREFVPLAVRSAETLLEMVSTLLDVNKMESGQMELVVEEVDLPAVVAAALDSVRAVSEQRGQEVVQAAPASSLPVCADREKLRRLLVNLLGNAVKFTPDKGRIEAGWSTDEQSLRLWVQDNGPGIPPEHRERIFEKFGQLEAGKAARRNSTGLGLTFCKMVAQAHGGRIWVEGELGQGSRFVVEIPRERPGCVRGTDVGGQA